MTMALRADAGGTNAYLQVNGVDRLAIDTNGNLTFAGTASANQTFSQRNRLINGGMQVDQRYSGAAVASVGGNYVADRWWIAAAGAVITAQRTGSVGSYALTITGAASNSAVSIEQRLESITIADLASQTVTISATISSSTLTSISWQIGYPSATDNFSSIIFPITQSFAITSTPTRYSYTFTVPSQATAGLSVRLITGAFTTGTLAMTNWQLETGTIATPFEQRSYGHELSLCQRYYYQIGPTSVAGTRVSVSGQAFNSTLGVFGIEFPTLMRTNPAFSSVGGTAATIFNGSANITTTGFVTDNMGPQFASIQATVASGLTAGQSCHLCALNTSAVTLQFSAEL